MKILHISTGKVWRGGERQTYFLIEQQINDGHEVHLMCHPASPLREKLNSTDVLTHNYQGSLYGKLKSSYALQSLSIKYNIDIIHGHDSHAHTLIWISSQFLNLKTKAVVSRRLTYKKNKASKKYNHKGIHKIICVSNAVKHSLSSVITDTSRLVTIYSGITLDKNNRTHQKKQSIHIGYVAALSPEKNHIAFLECAKRINHQDVHFHIYGEGQERAKIENTIQNDKLKVTVHGHINDLDLIYNQIDILLHTSKDEALGTSILDALKHGIPVIASNVGGIPELIDEGKGGYLSAPEDIEQLATSLSRLIENEELRNTFCTYNIEKAKLFDKKLTYQNTIQLYNQVLNS